ncbi:MAG TPA: acyltransferase [Polyangiaceae bacterium]|nr:acyltransferase [Polyangiaceae bacterium]
MTRAGAFVPSRGDAGARGRVAAAREGRSARRYPTLDLLRIGAAGMTVLLHAPSVSAELPLISSVQLGLNLGVDLFMLISGWLLGGQLIRASRDGELSAGRFYLKRWLRTLPPFYAVLLVLCFSGALSNAGGAEIASHFLFLQEYLAVQQYGVSWSLCVEEHFYLLLPLLVPFILRYGSARRLLLALVGVSLLELSVRTLVYEPGQHLPYLTHLRSEGLFLGLGLAYVAECRPLAWAWLGRWCHVFFILGVPATVLAMALSRTAPSLLFFTWLPTLGTWALALAFVASVHERSRLSRLELPGARYLGELTYSIYLVHTLVPPLLRHDALAPLGGSNAAALAVTLALSVLLHHGVERPFLTLRTRLLTARPTARLQIAPLARARSGRLD